MICSMIVFLYKIISIYLEICIIGHQTLGVALNDSKGETTRVPKAHITKADSIMAEMLLKINE